MDALAKSGQTTPDLKRSEAAALDEIASSLIDVGDTSGALTAAEQSRQIADDLVAANPNDAERQRDLAVSRNKVGNVQ